MNPDVKRTSMPASLFSILLQYAWMKSNHRPSSHSPWDERWIFLKNFVRHPLRNASVIPSSAAASRAILTGIDWKKTKTVIELGPGNGTFTRQILAQCMPGTKVILIELEESYVKILKQKFGEKIHVVHDSAHRMNEILQSLHLGKADLIVSSLPFLPNPVRQMVNDAILRQCRGGAAFRFFTYMPPVMKRFYTGMPIQKLKFVWNNIPPMWIYGIN
jgi:phospholipid N-methyltransferase